MRSDIAWYSVVVLGAVLGVASTPARAVPEPVAKRVADGNAAYAKGDYDAALEAYRAAAPDCPECPELAYNEGLVRYRQRDFGKARELFNNSLRTRDLHLEARAKFNLGSVAYAEALEKLNALPEAIKLAEEAIDRYRDALEVLAELDPRDPAVQQDLADARANIETAALLVKDLLDKQKQQQEQQKNDQSCDNPSDEQQEQGQQDQQEQEQQDSPDDNASSNGAPQDQQESQQQEPGEEQKQQQGDQQQQQAGQEEEQLQAAGQQAEQQQAEQDQQQAAEQAAAAQAEAGEDRPLTAEEVQRMLQSVRDKEAQRREQRAKKLRVKMVPVERDW